MTLLFLHLQRHQRCHLFDCKLARFSCISHNVLSIKLDTYTQEGFSHFLPVQMPKINWVWKKSNKINKRTEFLLWIRFERVITEVIEILPILRAYIYFSIFIYLWNAHCIIFLFALSFLFIDDATSINSEILKSNSPRPTLQNAAHLQSYFLILLGRFCSLSLLVLVTYLWTRNYILTSLKNLEGAVRIGLGLTHFYFCFADVLKAT